jgi:hypothetical protein
LRAPSRPRDAEQFSLSQDERDEYDEYANVQCEEEGGPARGDCLVGKKCQNVYRDCRRKADGCEYAHNTPHDSLLLSRGKPLFANFRLHDFETPTSMADPTAALVRDEAGRMPLVRKRRIGDEEWH